MVCVWVLGEEWGAVSVPRSALLYSPEQSLLVSRILQLGRASRNSPFFVLQIIERKCCFLQRKLQSIQGLERGMYEVVQASELLTPALLLHLVTRTICSCSRCLKAGNRCTYSKRKWHQVQPQYRRQHHRADATWTRGAERAVHSTSRALLAHSMLPFKRSDVLHEIAKILCKG